MAPNPEPKRFSPQNKSGTASACGPAGAVMAASLAFRSASAAFRAATERAAISRQLAEVKRGMSKRRMEGLPRQESQRLICSRLALVWPDQLTGSAGKTAVCLKLDL